MSSKLAAVIVGTSLIMASACATKSGTGTAVGAGAGGLLGGAIGGTTGALIGVVAGGVLGYGIGREMEERDRRQVVYALETNRAMQWRNDQTGNQYQVEPTETFIDDGRQCREFRINAQIDGKPDEVNGIACRQPDGDWELQG